MIRNGFLTLVLFAALFASGRGQVADQAIRETPLVSYGFVVDNSGSYRIFLERAITIIRSIVDSNGIDDEAFLVTFVDQSKTVVRQELTSDKGALVDAAENMFVEGGPTAMLDAVRFSIDYLSANAKPDRNRTRSLLLITDGDDRGSAAKVETVIAAARNSNIRIVVIGMSEEKVNFRVLDRLAKETGGKAFYPKLQKDVLPFTERARAAIRGTEN